MLQRYNTDWIGTSDLPTLLGKFKSQNVALTSRLPFMENVVVQRAFWLLSKATLFPLFLAWVVVIKKKKNPAKLDAAMTVRGRHKRKRHPYMHETHAHGVVRVRCVVFWESVHVCHEFKQAGEGEYLQFVESYVHPERKKCIFRLSRNNYHLTGLGSSLLSQLCLRCVVSLLLGFSLNLRMRSVIRWETKDKSIPWDQNTMNFRIYMEQC